MPASSSLPEILVAGEPSRVGVTIDLLRQSGLNAVAASETSGSIHCRLLWLHLDASAPPELETLTRVLAERRVVHATGELETSADTAEQVAALTAWSALVEETPLVWVAETEGTRNVLARHLPPDTLAQETLAPPLLEARTARPPTERPRIGLAAPEGLGEAHLRLLEDWKAAPLVAVQVWDGSATPRSARPSIPDTWCWFGPEDLPLRRFAALTDLVVFAERPADDRLPAAVALEGAVPVLPSPGPTSAANLAPSDGIDLADWVSRLAADAEARTTTVRQERRKALAAYGPLPYVQTLRRLGGLDAPTMPETFPADRRGNEAPAPVLFIGTNGIGIGHLTRLLAVARRCPKTVQPVFAVFSAATRLVREAGYPCEHILSNEYAEADPADWHASVAQELRAIIRFYEPQAVVYDGNVLYPGVAKALATASLPLLWIHRGLYRAGASTAPLERHKLADVVIEPGELAAPEERGPTTAGRPREAWPRRFLRVNPVTWAGPQDILPRAAARRSLDMPSEGRAVLIQVGAGTLRDTARLVDRLVRILERWPEITVYLAEWPITDRPAPPQPGVVTLRHYPMSPCLLAFDIVVSATGYNSFHELMALGVPTLLVANEFTRIDDQPARARHAAAAGLAEVAAAEDTTGLAAALDRLMTATSGMARREPPAQWPWENGATTIAAWTAALAGRGEWPA